MECIAFSLNKLIFYNSSSLLEAFFKWHHKLKKLKFQIV